MTGLAALLEDFAPYCRHLPGGGAPAATVTEAETEARERAAFEEGYKAGWDDAVAAEAAEGGRLSEGLAQTLLDLSFTYHEAYSHILRELEPLFTELVDHILPEALQESIGLHVVETLQERARGLVEYAVEIRVSAEDLLRVRDFVGPETGVEATVASDPRLGPGQAEIRLGSRQDRVDLSALADGIRDAVAAFTDQARRSAESG
ncbi:ABC transporter ATP-binding protein [Litorisediminicola beolgyonensis]|uniref:ABC transporter ATP-binding protein n=1 Tax=Litorisediminicola beolgyonensis TaxID=1173614 RepID=A0ABW3ZKE5_9RHOB